jgi:microcystin-dependent protein
MSDCQNCYNGCTEIVSDRCVKYTGIAVPALGIQTGDTLSSIEQSLIAFLLSALDGTGIVIDLSEINICSIVQSYLPISGDITIVDISKALIQASCDLQEQDDVIVAELAILNADYTISCLEGVTASSDTHSIVQATISALCTLRNEFDQLVIDLPFTYVALDNLYDLIQVYLNSETGNLISSKMVPYSVLPYFGPITFFNSSGAGTGDWLNVYLCNGDNGTPDLRGRALTGVINGVPGPELSSYVNPMSSAANPNYSLYDNVGANQITLLSSQLPVQTHTHTSNASSVVTDPGHSHTTAFGNPVDANQTGSSNTWVQTGSATTYPTTSAVTGITVATTVTNSNVTQGEGLPHSNIQPVTACYYIQYRP